MKTLIITMTIFLGLPNLSQAQVYKHSLGLRYGTGFRLRNSEFSYQLGLNPKNRIEFGLGYRQGDFGIFSYRHLTTSIYYQHVMKIDGGFNWYIGAGIKYDFNQYIENEISAYYHSFSVGPTIGLEYDFNKKNIPIVLAVDYRPSILLSPNGAPAYFNQFGLSLHYTFKDKSAPLSE